MLAGPVLRLVHMWYRIRPEKGNCDIVGRMWATVLRHHSPAMVVSVSAAMG